MRPVISVLMEFLFEWVVVFSDFVDEINNQLGTDHTQNSF